MQIFFHVIAIGILYIILRQWLHNRFRSFSFECYSTG